MTIDDYRRSIIADRGTLDKCGDAHSKASAGGLGTNMGPISSRYYEALEAVRVFDLTGKLPKWAE